MEVTTPIGLKLAISAATGVIVGGLSYMLRKKRLGSLVLGVATGVSTYLFHK